MTSLEEELTVVKSRLAELEWQVSELARLLPDTLGLDKPRTPEIFISPKDLEQYSNVTSHVESEVSGREFVWVLGGKTMSFTAFVNKGQAYQISIEVSADGLEDVEKQNIESASIIADGRPVSSSAVSRDGRLYLEALSPEASADGAGEVSIRFDKSFCPALVYSGSQDNRILALRCFGISIRNVALAGRVKFVPLDM